MPSPGDLSTLVAVDGHNLLNDVGRHVGAADESWWTGLDPDIRKMYYRDWFDIDRLVEATISRDMQPWRDLGIVVFHSNKAMGDRGKEHRFESPAQENFWARQGGNPNTATHLVEIQGAPAGKDAGMDTTIVVYMFETMDRWDAAVLFTNDADFVPAVWALRRKGKRVFCAAPVGDRDSPLVRACQHFYHWNLGFLSTDRLFFTCAQKGGALDQVLSLQRLRDGGFKVLVSPAGIVLSGPPEAIDSRSERDMNEILLPFELSVARAGLMDYGEGTMARYQVQARAGSTFPAWNLAVKGIERHASTACAGAMWFSNARIG
jgi:hypothetical protein